MLTYNDLMTEIGQLNRLGIETGNIGNSVLGQTIPYIFAGKKSGVKLIVQCAMHAREHITALFGLCLAKHLATTSALIDGGIYIVPMVNPDGVRLCQEGVSWIEDDNTASNLIAINNDSKDFALWKSNANGVDLNVNWDACWGKGAQNVFVKSNANYVGPAPMSEAENIALFNMTRMLQPDMTLSYHCKGEIIYWQFGQQAKQLERDYKYASAIARHTGYQLGEDSTSCGGYKDWCIQTLDIPSFTIEVGSDNYDYPYPYSQIDNILTANIDLPRKLVNSLAKQLQGGP